MSDKTVTPEMIDDDLVLLITTQASFHDYSLNSIIRAVLACLANRPMKPTQEQDEELDKAFLASTAAFGMKPTSFGAIHYQRIAFLKKEPELPQEVKSLLWEGNPFPNTGAQNRHDQAVIAAYKIGKGEEK